jgi:DNA-binding MarR family transcriptional regulator
MLAECLQGFDRFSGEFVRGYGLTHGQFDILATLGNTCGMSYKELGERTLITKGTLTGVIERLEQKGLVERERNRADKRSFFVRLTPQGEDLFRDVFPKVIEHGKKMFASYGTADFDKLDEALCTLLRSMTDAWTTSKEKEPS